MNEDPTQPTAPSPERPPEGQRPQVCRNCGHPLDEHAYTNVGWGCEYTEGEMECRCSEQRPTKIRLTDRQRKLLEKAKERLPPELQGVDACPHGAIGYHPGCDFWEARMKICPTCRGSGRVSK